MPLVNATWKRLKLLLLPALVLACWLAWMPTSVAQLPAPTQKLFQAVDVNDMNGVKAAIAAGADLAAKNPAGSGPVSGRAGEDRPCPSRYANPCHQNPGARCQ
ncbi:MAG: hypothetical protein HQ483_20405 [Rhodospirillales bacterium]|nr:hypothetical protein [Rhodospirillales bacterium]